MERVNQVHSFKSKPQTENWDQLLSQLIKNEKSDIHLLEWSGFVALENKQWQLAENVFYSLLKRRDKVLDLIGLGKALCSQSQLDAAENSYLSALDKITEPCSLLFIVYKSLGEIHLLKKDFYQAEEYFNKASTLNPHCSSLIFHRAMLYLKEKNYKTAEEYFQIFVKTNLNSAKAWLGLALSRKALGDEELALACLARSLDFEPDNNKALGLKKKWNPSLSEMLSNALSFSA